MKAHTFYLYIIILFMLSACIPAPPPPSMMSKELSSRVDLDQVIDMGQNPAEDMNSIRSSCETSNGIERQWTGVIYELKFGREDPNGISLGDNIDELVSDNQDPNSCYQSDLRSPEGEEGIDNQFAKIIPLIEAVGGEAIEGLAQGIINQGRLLMMLHLSALDDERLIEDDCFHLESFYGAGTPQIGTHGFIVSGQTFDRDHQRPSIHNDRIVLDEGYFQVEGLMLEVPLEVFDQSYLFKLNHVRIHGQFDSQGELHGFISGAIDVEDVAQRVEQIEGGGMVAELMPRFLRQQADLFPNEDGICRGLSITLTYRAKRAFIYPEDANHP